MSLVLFAIGIAYLAFVLVVLLRTMKNEITPWISIATLVSTLTVATFVPAFVPMFIVACVCGVVALVASSVYMSGADVTRMFRRLHILPRIG